MEETWKIPAWDLTKVRNESEVIDEARTKGRKVHFASLMDICHLKNAELETKHHKYKGRVVLRGDIVNDDSGSYAVFTEQGSSASRLTPARVMDIISRLPRCAGQAADAVSAYTQVKMEDAPKLLKIPESECPDTNGQNHGPVWKTQSFLLNKFCVVILWQDCYGKGNLWKSYWNTVGRKFPIGNAYSYTVKKDYSSYQCLWMTSNWLERNKTLIRCGKYSKKKLIWENQHLSLIMSWDVLKNNVKWDIVDNYRTMFESRISAVWTEKLPCSENLSISSWSYDMEGHAKKCVERCCELANKTTQQLYKVSTPCIDDHMFKEELRSVGELSKYALKLFWNAFTWHVLEDLMFYGQWTNLHDRSQNGPKPAVTLSSPASSCVLFDIASRLLMELKWLMLNKHKRWFHSSRVKFPLVSMSASWLLVSMYLIWILGAKLILSNNQSRATLWVLETCLIVVTSSLYNHVDHCFVVLKHIQQSFLTTRMHVWGNKINIVWINNHSMSFLLRWKFVRSCTNQFVGLTVLDYTDTCFREELRRSDPINHVRVYRPYLVLHPRKWFLILLNCVKLRFASHTSNLLEQMYDFPKRTSSARSRFWVLKISRKIGVLKQSQPALFCSITHITILFIFTGVMNVKDQTIQSFVTGFGPFRDRSCKFVHWP